MPRRAPWGSSRRRLPIPGLALTLTLWIAPWGRGQETPPPAAPSVELADSIVTALSAEAERCAKLRARQAEAEMERMVESLGRLHSLDETALAQLEKAGARAAKDSLEAWGKEFRAYRIAAAKRYQAKFVLPPDTFIQRLLGRGDGDVLRTFHSPEKTRPRSQPAWTKSLAEVLTEAQLAARKESVADEIAARDKRVEAFLDDLMDSVEAEQGERRADLLTTVKKVARPDPIHAEKIDSLAREADAAMLKQLRASARYFLARADTSLWPISTRLAVPGSLAQSPAWRTGLEALLTPEQNRMWRQHLEREEKAEAEQLTAILKANEVSARATARQQSKELLEQLFDAAELDEATRKKFAETAEASVELSLADWKRTRLNELRKIPRENRNELALRSQFQFSQQANLAGPETQEPWNAAVETLLTPAQQAAWRAAKTLREEEAARKMTEMIDATARTHKVRAETALAPRLQEVIASLKLGEKRAGAFRDAGGKAVAQGLEAWKKQAREWLAGLSAEQRVKYLNQGSVPMGFSDNHAAAKQQAWTEAFPGILTPEERARWAALQLNREVKRQDAVAGMMLVVIEDWVGIDADQWPPLAELCRETSAGLTSRFDQRHFYINLLEIAQALKEIPEKQIRNILDDSQWERWREAVDLTERRYQPRRGQSADEPRDAPAEPDAVVVQRAVTRLIYERNREQRREFLLRLRAETDTVARAIQLPPEQVARLETAAKGAAEEAVSQWVGNFSNYARRQAKGATPKTIQQKLATVGNYGSRREDPRNTRVWKQAFDSLLDDTQTKAWSVASTAREIRRRAAISPLIAAFFEARLGLGAEQAGAFHEMISTSIETYEADITHMFPPNNSRWYLQQHSMGIAVMGIPREALKDLLSEEQFEVWETQFQNQAANYWKNIQRYHRQRLKSEKESGKQQGTNP